MPESYSGRLSLTVYVFLKDRSQSRSVSILFLFHREWSESYPLAQGDKKAGQCKYKRLNLNLLFKFSFSCCEGAVKFFLVKAVNVLADLFKTWRQDLRCFSVTVCGGGFNPPPIATGCASPVGVNDYIPSSFLRHSGVHIRDINSECQNLPKTHLGQRGCVAVHCS